MSAIRDAVLKEIVKFGPNEGHLSAEFFANVRSLCQEHAAMEGELSNTDDLLARRAALDDLPTRYEKIQKAIVTAGEKDKAEATVTALRAALVETSEACHQAWRELSGLQMDRYPVSQVILDLVDKAREHRALSTAGDTGEGT